MAMQADADVVPAQKPGSASVVVSTVQDRQETSDESVAGDVGVSMEEISSLVEKQEEGEEKVSIDGRERLKRHRNEVAGRVRVPDMWDQEVFLKDWRDCSNQFDVSLSSSKIMSARAALLEEGRGRDTMNMKMKINIKMNVKSSAGLSRDGRCFSL